MKDRNSNKRTRVSKAAARAERTETSARADVTEHKQAEEALRESEERLRLALDAAQMGTFDWDLLHDRVTWSRRHEELWGFKPGEFGGTYEAFSERVHPDDLPGINAEVARCIAAGAPSSVEFRVVWPDGGVHWIEGLGEFTFGDDGQPVRMRGAVVDITTRKQAEEALRQSEQRYRTLFETAPDGVAVFDPQMKILMMNRRALEIYGYENSAEMIGLSGLDIIAPQFRARARQNVTRILELGFLAPIESIGVKKDGTQFAVETSAALIRNAQGKPATVLGIARDITGRKRAEAALREAEQKYRDIFENADEGIFQSTPEGRFLVANPALARMHGFDSPEDLIRSRDDISRQIYVDRARREEFKRMLKENGILRGFEHQVFRKDGSKIWISVNARVVRDEAGAIRYYEGTAQDINERKRAEARSAAFAVLARKLSGARTPIDAGRIIAQTAGDLFGWDSCNLDLYDSDRDLIHPMLNVDTIDGKQTDVTALISDREPTPRSRRVIAHGQELILREEPIRFDEDAVPFGDKSRPSASIMAVPIRHAAKVIGLLSIQSYTTHSYDASALDDLQTLADYCGEALNRIQAEQSLYESEENYRDLVENSREFICTHDLDGLILSANRAAMDLLGYDPTTYCGKRSIRDILAPEVRHQFDEYMARLCKDGATSGIMLVQTMSGERRVWEYYNTLRTEGVAAPIVRGMARDITDQKRAEEVLRVSEKRFRTLIENSSDAIVLLDADGMIIDHAPRTGRVMGYANEGLVGRDVLEMIHPEDRALVRRVLNELLTGEAQGITLQFRALHRTGSSRWGEAVAANHLGDPEVRAIVVNYRDITERKQAEAALQESEERFRQLSDAAFEAIILHDQGTILEVNQSFCRMYGYERAEMIGKSVLDLALPEFRELLRQKVRSGDTGPYEGPALRKDGTIFRAEVAGKPIHYQGRVVRVAAIRDITEQRRNERRQAAQYAVTRVLAESATLAEATPQLLQVICESLRWKMGEFWRVCDSTNLLRCVETWHVPALEATSFIEASRQTELAPGVGLPGRVWQSGQPVWIPDVMTDPRFARAAIAAKVGLRGAVAFPILLGNHTLGLMLFFSRRTPEVDEDLLKIMSAIGSQIGQFTERKRAEDALLASERKYRDIFTFAPVGIYQSLRDGTLITANKALAEMLGYASVDELLRVKLGSGVYFAEDEREKLIREYEGLGYAVDLDMQWKRKDGSPICVQLSAQAIKGPNGETEYFEGFVRDITERKRAEESLRKQNEYLAALHETALGLINRLDLDELLEDIVTRACALVDIPGGYVYLIEPGGTGMRVKVGVGVSRDFVGALIRKGEGLAGRIWQTGKPLVVDDYRNWEHRLTDAGYDVLLTVGAVPLRSGSQVVGVLGVESTEDGQGLGEHQIEILNRFAQLASIALDNAQLHSAVQQELAERKRAGEELRASEERYRELFEQASDVIFKTDARGNWGSFNPAAVKLLKYGEKELTGKYYLDLVKPEYRSAVKGFYQEQFRTKTPNTRYEFPAIAKDGTEVWIEQRATLLFENDQAAGLHLVARDITERKRAEAALRESEERYRDLVENSHELICTHDLDGKILSANRAVTRLLGYDPHEFIGKGNIRDILAPEVRHQFDEDMARVCKDGATSGIMLVQTSSGERRVWEYYNSLRTEGVATPIVRGMARDITEQRHAEKAISDLRRELELTMNSMEEGVHRVDLEGKIVFENPAAARMLGWEVAELLGKPAHVTMHHTRQDGTPYPKEECPIYATLRDGIFRQGAEEVFWRRDGTSFPVEYMTAPMRNDRNEIVATVVTFRDITERKRAQDALRIYSQRLIQAQDAERQHIARELHDEIGQVLTAVKINLQSVQRSCRTADCLPRLDESIGIVDEALGCVRELSIELHPSLLDDLGLSAALRWYVDRYAERTGIIAEVLDGFEVDGRLPRELETACFRIAQEALTNVARHAQAGSVSVQLERSRERMLLTVMDDGVGFDIDNLRKKAPAASILGLRGMEERALAIGGHIEIDSGSGRGTRVRAIFPLKRK